MNELRPCVVCLPKQFMQYRNEHGNIVTEITKKPEKRKGYFHIWASKQWTIGDSLLVGGYSKGQMSEVVGIVEYEDGTVHEHLPCEIRFTDREEQDEKAESK